MLCAFLTCESFGKLFHLSRASVKNCVDGVKWRRKGGDKVPMCSEAR